MVTALDKYTDAGCSTDNGRKVCRSRGGESCAFDGAMIVLQPIADTAHLVHGPIACCGNSWEGRGTLSTKGVLHTMGFTTDMSEIDIVYGAEEKLYQAISRVRDAVKPRAIFVYATCVSGLIGEDLDAVCRRAEQELDVRVIPVPAPGFVGPKNLGNRIAGDVLLEHVIGTDEPPVITPTDINLIGEYNIAGDLWQIEPLLAQAGIRIMSRITGNAAFREIAWAHRAKLNVVVCSRALINLAREMEHRYGIPFVEVSFFGSTEIAKALRAIAGKLHPAGVRSQEAGDPGIGKSVEGLIRNEERKLKSSLKPYRHLRGKKAVLYTGGVKSWSFLSALGDLGIEIVAVGTKKSSVEDEEKMKQILGPAAPLEENVTPGNLLRLLRERGADMLIAGGRNQYLAAKEGYPFVDVNQERHRAYAGYEGLVRFAEDISAGLRFYDREAGAAVEQRPESSKTAYPKPAVLINPLKHSPSMGAAMALQGIERALPVIHGAQGCTFLGKVLLTKHFREPIALVGSKLFLEDVVMGGGAKLLAVIRDAVQKNRPSLVGVLTSGLSEVKGDDVGAIVREARTEHPGVRIVHIPTPDYEGGLETGYARAVEAMIDAFAGDRPAGRSGDGRPFVTILADAHHTPADATELRDMTEAFGLDVVILPDLSALDGSRQGFSPLAIGGTTIAELESLPRAAMVIALGRNMLSAGKLLEQRFGTPVQVIDNPAGLEGGDALVRMLEQASGRSAPARFARQRRVLMDAMRDAQAAFVAKRICIALEPDHAVQVSRCLAEAGATVASAIIPELSGSADRIRATDVRIGDLFSIHEACDLLLANSHGEQTAKRLGVPFIEAGFPVYKSFGYTAKVTIGYRGALSLVQEVATALMRGRGES